MMNDYKKLEDDLKRAIAQQKSVRESELKNYNTTMDRVLLLEDIVDDFETAYLMLAQYGLEEFEEKYDHVLYPESDTTETDPLSFNYGLREAYFETLDLHENDIYEADDDNTVFQNFTIISEEVPAEKIEEFSV